MEIPRWSKKPATSPPACPIADWLRRLVSSAITSSPRRAVLPHRPSPPYLVTSPCGRLPNGEYGEWDGWLHLGDEEEDDDSSKPVAEELEDSLEIVVSLTPFEEEQAPKVELKPLPSSLRYVFLGSNSTYPVIISSSLKEEQLVYFDRVQFKGMRVNRTYPTIVGWSAELARKRVREENKAGSFGRGTVLPRIAKPADIAAATSGQTDQPPVAALNIPSSSVDKVAGILQKLASTVGEFGEAMAEIGNKEHP
nr:uncharacterized protein LOC109158994 [Ipomoea batatas]